jgi:hypothetical protein
MKVRPTAAAPAAIDPVTDALWALPAGAKDAVPSAKLAKAFMPGSASVLPSFLAQKPPPAINVIWKPTGISMLDSCR